MKFGKYLEEKQRPEWAEKYLNYKALKDLIKEAYKQQQETGAIAYSPRTTSLTVQRAMDSMDNGEERFFQLLEAEVDKVGSFTANVVNTLRERLFKLQSQVKMESTPQEKDNLVEEAQAIGDEFLQLEKYVNLNYMGFHKILKKHDKNMPQSPCRQFYISHLHNQPWVQGNYSDLLLVLSHVYSELRGDVAPNNVDDGDYEERSRYSTTRYWVSNGDVSRIKHMILQHLPVFQFNESEYSGDSQLVNSVYLDNSSLEVYHGRLDERPNAMVIRLNWFGSQDPTEVHLERQILHGHAGGRSEDVERAEISLPENSVVEFLEGEITADAVQEFWRTKGESTGEVDRDTELFNEVQKVIDAKQLKPMIRTQYMRTYFQIPFEPTVRINLDTNICMIKENPEEGPTCTMAGRWYRDPSFPIHRTEITRFPHAVLELELAIAPGDTTPEWVQELVESGMLTEIERFSKHVHGVATLFQDMVQALPYWVDDDSVRASMLNSAPEQPVEVAVTARDKLTSQRSKPRKGHGTEGDSLLEPLLRRTSTFEETSDLRRSVATKQGLMDWWFSKPAIAPRPKIPGVLHEKIEPKTHFANERTFLAWLHMALTMGSIAAAMLGFSTSGSRGADSTVTLIAMVLLPVALMMVGYSLLVFYWRSQAIRNKTGLYYDDRRGPLALTIVVVAALASIFLISLVDLVGNIMHKDDPSLRTGTPMTWFKSTLLFRLRDPSSGLP